MLKPAAPLKSEELDRRRNEMRRLVASVVLFVAATASAGVQEGIAAKGRGDYGAAYREFLPLAEAGDVRAAITIGLLFHEGGVGLPQDYAKAMDWYVRALEAGDGDALNNVGVMYRDGLGVKKNRSIAFGLFLIVHMPGLGSENTVMRANRNLRREREEMTSAEHANAMCMTEEFVRAYVLARGDQDKIPQSARNPTHQKLRDKDWWLDSERAELPPCQ